jgi:hypothetical protein
MKPFGLIIILLLLSSNLFAQKLTPKAIEADLLKSFKKIEYWNVYKYDHRDNTDNYIKAEDSLEIANDHFSKKLKFITSKYPSTISQKFYKLQHWGMGIVTSSDNLLKIYSWDTEMGGRMHDYQNLIQYKAGQKVNTILKTDTAITNNDGYIYYYTKLYKLTAGSKTFYLAIYNGIFGSLYCGEGVQVFSIENGKLNQDTKIIKTKTGLHSNIYYNYFVSEHDDILYDSASKIIKIPLVNEKEIATGKYITYKFTGKYFEKVK